VDDTNGAGDEVDEREPAHTHDARRLDESRDLEEGELPNRPNEENVDVPRSHVRLYGDPLGEVKVGDKGEWRLRQGGIGRWDTPITA
jgi:hypothetical protein